MVKKKINNFPKRKRRSNQEICVDLKKERNKLYKIRSKASKELDNPNIRVKKKKSLESKLDRSSNKINSINVRLVKCSVRWDNFKKNKRKIRSKINSLKREVRKGDLSTTEINRIIHEIREYSNQIQMLEGDVYQKYIDEAILPTGKYSINTIDNGNIVEQYLVVWELKDKVQDAIATEQFDTIDIDGEYSSVIDLGAVVMDLDIFITDIADKQHLTATPMVILIFDFENRMIRVINNTSEI